MTAYLRKSNSSTLEAFAKIENLLIEYISEKRQQLAFWNTSGNI